jgi:hypothetical protein
MIVLLAACIWFFRKSITAKLADDALREQWYLYIATDPDMSSIVDSTTAEFLLSEAKALVAQKRDAIKNYEGKAASYLALVGGGVGVFSLLAGTDLHPIVGSPTLLISGAVALLGSLVLDVICIAISNAKRAADGASGSQDESPWLDVFNYAKTVAEPRAKGRIAYSLTEGFLEVANRLSSVIDQKRRVFVLATIAFVIGLVLIALNVFVALLNPNRPKDAGEQRLTVHVAPLQVHVVPGASKACRPQRRTGAICR